jgi:hypothetical protein
LREKFKTQREGNWTSSRPHVSDQASSLIGRNRAQKSSGMNSFIMSNLEDDQGQTTVMDAKDLHLLLALPSTRFSLSQSDQDWEDTSTSEAKIE